MTFDHNDIPKIIAGKLTTTTITHQPKGRPYRQGHTYAVNPRIPRREYEDGTIRPARIAPAITRIRITHIQRIPDGWKLTFEHEPAALPRLMHKQSERGYTTQRRDALDPDTDAVDADVLNEYAKENRERHELRQLERAQADQRTLTERLQRLLDAQTRGIDVSRQLASIRQRIEAGERKLRRAA